MTKTKSLLLVFALLLAGPVLAGTQWLHVHIENPENQERVKMNIPISLVETMVPLIEEKGVEKGVIRLHDKDINVRDLRNAWKQIRSQGDNEFLSLENRDTNLKVFIRGNYFYVQPQDSSRKQVNIQIPLSVVDAMLSGQGEELNLAAAVQALKQSGAREIVTVKDEEKSVRIWIDESNQAR